MLNRDDVATYILLAPCQQHLVLVCAMQESTLQRDV